MSPSSYERYPTQYEDRLILKNGKSVFNRPLCETDEPLILALLDKLGLDSIYLRFLTYLKSLLEYQLFQLTYIGYSNQFAIVAVIPEDGKDSLIAVARY